MGSCIFFKNDDIPFKPWTILMIKEFTGLWQIDKPVNFFLIINE